MKFTQVGADGKEATFEVPDDAAAELMIDGKPVKMTAKGIADAANKVTAADRRFAEAAAMRSEAAEGKVIVDLSKRAETDDAAFRQLATMLGHDEATAEQLLRQFRDQQAGGGEEGGAAAGNPQGSGGTQKTPPLQQMTTEQIMKLLPPEMLMRIQRADDAVMDQGREKGLKMMREALDKHPVLGKLKDGQKDFLIGKLDDVRSGTVSRDSMAGFIIGRLQQGYRMSPELLADGVAQAAKLAGDIGLNETVVPPPEVRGAEARRVVQDLQMGGVGLGPTGDALAAAVQTGKVPDRKPITDPDSEDTMVVRALQGAYDATPKEGQEH